MDKTTIILIVGVMAVVLFDAYSKYAKEKSKYDLRAQQLANQTILQLEQEKNRQLNKSGGGILGGLKDLIGL